MGDWRLSRAQPRAHRGALQPPLARPCGAGAGGFGLTLMTLCAERARNPRHGAAIGVNSHTETRPMPLKTCRFPFAPGPRRQRSQVRILSGPPISSYNIRHLTRVAASPSGPVLSFLVRTERELHGRCVQNPCKRVPGPFTGAREKARRRGSRRPARVRPVLSSTCRPSSISCPGWSPGSPSRAR